MESRKGMEGRGGLRWWERFLGHLLIFRLMTRGLIRSRRGSSTASATSPSRLSHQRRPPSLLLGTSGNRHRRIRERRCERHLPWRHPLALGRLEHQGSYHVVRQQQPFYLLNHPRWCL